MKNNLFIIFTLLLLANKSLSLSTLELGQCLVEQLGFNVIFFIKEYLEVAFSFNEEKIKAFMKSHPEVIDAMSFCMTKPELVLRDEAELIIKNFFGINYKVSTVNFDEEYVVSEFPKITFKFEAGCEFTLLESDSYVTIKGGTVISQKGINTTFTDEYAEELSKLMNFDMKKSLIELERKIKGTITEGTVYIRIYIDKIEIGFIINREFNEKTTCEGKMIITIEPGELPTPPPGMEPEYTLDEDIIKEIAKKAVVAGGLIGVVYGVIAIAKGVISAIGIAVVVVA